MTNEMLEILRRLVKYCQSEGISINAVCEGLYGGIYIGRDAECQDFSYTLGDNYFSVWDDDSASQIDIPLEDNDA